MATARVVYTWADEDQLVCEIRVNASYPDAVNEAKTQAMGMFREAMAALIPATTEADTSE